MWNVPPSHKRDSKGSLTNQFELFGVPGFTKPVSDVCFYDCCTEKVAETVLLGFYLNFEIKLKFESS